MIYRNVYSQLKQWSDKPNRKPLILRGARQVGKTTSVDEFAKDFDNYIHLNLEKKTDADFFRFSDSVREIVQTISFRTSTPIKGRTLFFIDEIQNEPKSVALLRYFYEEMPELYVIAAGSRLQSLIHEHISFPVGRVEYLQLTPCNFGEFLGATGRPQYKDAVDNFSLPELLHDEVMSLFNTYTVIGGMPEIVSLYAQTGDFNQLRPVYNTLLKGYEEDVEKYSATQKQNRIIRHILQTGWSEAGKTIKLGNFGNSQYPSGDIREAFTIMEKAFLLQLCYPVTSVKPPVLSALRRAPKLFWFDTGLVNFATGIQPQLVGRPSLTDSWQGSITEHIVAQELRCVLYRNYVENLSFWVRDKKGSNAETDFIWQHGNMILPVEVKTGTNSHIRSCGFEWD